MKKLLSILLVFFSVAGMANAQESVNPSFKKGPAGMVEVGTLFNQGFSGGYASVSSGYNVLPGLFTGVGIGFKTQEFSVHNENSLLVPVYAQVRYSLLNKTFSPFIDLKAGLLADYTKSLKTVNTPYPDNGCGHFFKAAIGVDYKRFSLSVGDDWGIVNGKDKYSWTVGLTYRF